MAATVDLTCLTLFFSRHMWFAKKRADVLRLTRFGGGGRSEERDHQQDEEEQVEDPHDCVRNLFNKSAWVLFFLLPKFSLSFRTSAGGTQSTRTLLCRDNQFVLEECACPARVRLSLRLGAK